ncbi:hypothetical protein AZE42_02506 [Rhizopogon vesiculosus]|uniref:C2H2-type domain-containing protein n=1 Tax=Rhizopogon vesiculosus TaxID=180088 RepID=A0A1J8QIT6_9AGAM|nr:hypothetical protein AZE42_02506 [Rhizopogon vesiculosus]
MPTIKPPCSPCFPDDNPLGHVNRFHADRPGQSHGCPCYVALQYILGILFPYSPYPHLSPAILSDIFSRLMSAVDDHSYLNILHTTMADSVTPWLAPYAGFSPSCHNLSPMEPNSIHHALPPTLLNTDNDMNSSSINGPDPMPVYALDSVSSIFGEPYCDFNATASMDVGLSHMSSEPADSRWFPSGEPLFDGNSVWDQGLENKGTYSDFEEHSSHTVHHQPHNSSSVHLPDLVWYSSPCSEEGSSLESEYSSFMDDHNIHLCRWDAGCGLCVEAEKSDVARHLQATHGVKPGGDKLFIPCLWDGCEKVMKKESLSRHIVAVHLSKKTECTSCGKQFARLDSKLRHIKNSKRECSDSESESHDSPAKRLRLS